MKRSIQVQNWPFGVSTPELIYFWMSSIKTARSSLRVYISITSITPNIPSKGISIQYYISIQIHLNSSFTLLSGELPTAFSETWVICADSTCSNNLNGWEFNYQNYLNSLLDQTILIETSIKSYWNCSWSHKTRSHHLRSRTWPLMLWVCLQI